MPSGDGEGQAQPHRRLVGEGHRLLDGLALVGQPAGGEQHEDDRAERGHVDAVEGVDPVDVGQAVVAAGLAQLVQGLRGRLHVGHRLDIGHERANLPAGSRGAEVAGATVGSDRPRARQRRRAAAASSASSARASQRSSAAASGPFDLGELAAEIGQLGVVGGGRPRRPGPARGAPGGGPGGRAPCRPPSAGGAGCWGSAWRCRPSPPRDGPGAGRRGPGTGGRARWRWPGPGGGPGGAPPPTRRTRRGAGRVARDRPSPPRR